MPILLKPIFTRLFLFMYILGTVSCIVTAPDTPVPRKELFADMYMLSALVMLVPRGWLRSVVKAVVYTVMYPLYIVDTFCFVKFGSTLNPTMLMLLGETNGGEASEFLSSYLTWDVLLSPVGLVLLVPLVHVVCAVAFRRVRFPRLQLVRTVRIALNVLVLGMIVWSCVSMWDNKRLYVKTMTSSTIGEVEHSLAVHPHTDMYQPPMRLAFSIRSNQLVAQQMERIMMTTGRAQVDSCDFKSQNIVLIIGESFNKRHAQLYGYDKPNMPNQVRMKKQGFLTPLDDVVTPWNLTSYFFKHLMTTYCVGDSLDWCDYPLFCQLFREAGYEVTFLTNQFLPQAKEAVWDFSGGFFLNDSTLSRAQFDYRNERLHVFDDGLLGDYDEIRKQTAAATSTETVQPRGHLTIFHLMGQHVTYRIRCPNSKKKWGVNEYPNDTDILVRRRRVLADYDNAVWFNDSVVNQIVQRFRNEDAIIIYVPDHGEEVFGPGVRHFFGRMHDANITRRLAEEEFRVPMWIYCTQRYISRHPEVFRQVKASKDKRYMTDRTSHMLLGLAGIHTPWYKADCDLLSPSYDEQRPRLLKHSTDYDALK